MPAVPPLTFDAATHTYRLLGAVVPSVTQVLAPLSQFEGIDTTVLARKAALGRAVHEACWYDDDGDLDDASVSDEVRGYLNAYRAFILDSGSTILSAEMQVAEPVMQYAGTLDRVMEIDGVQWLVDLKTSITTPRTAGPQTAAYLRALGDNSVTRRAALRLRPDGTYRFDHLTDPDDWATFVACLTVHRFKETHQ